jgi:hypothetical protein
MIIQPFLKEYVNNFDLNTSVLSMMLNMTFSIFYLNQLLEYWPQQLRISVSFTRIWFSSTGVYQLMSAIVRVLLSQILIGLLFNLNDIQELQNQLKNIDKVDFFEIILL